MPRRKPVPSRRYHVTFEPADADVLEEEAQRVGRAPSTLIAILAREALERIRSGVGDEAAELRRQLGRAESERDRLRARLHQLQQQAIRGQKGQLEETELPRYAWPIEDLLADRTWWARLLPLLYELLGRPSGTRAQQEPIYAVDDRGYHDLLGHLFPPILEAEDLPWDHPEYGAQADRPLREIWEPVLRHVARALCALESTLGPAADPFTTMRVVDEIGGPWLAALTHITGDQAPPDLKITRGQAKLQDRSHP